MNNIVLSKDIMEVGGRMFHDFIYKGGIQLPPYNLETVHKYLDIYTNKFNIKEFNDFFENFQNKINLNTTYCIHILLDLFLNLKKHLVFLYNTNIPYIEVNIYDNKIVFLFNKKYNDVGFIKEMENFFDNFFTKHTNFDYLDINDFNIKDFVQIGFKESRIGRINSTLNIKYSFDTDLFDFLRDLEYDRTEDKPFCKTEFKIVYNEKGNKKIKYYFRFLDYLFENDNLDGLQYDIRNYIIDVYGEQDEYLIRIFDGINMVYEKFLNELNHVKNDIYRW